MKRFAVVKMSFPSERRLKTALNTLKPETRESRGVRSRTTVKAKDGKLVIQFKAEDTSALRASMNVYLRWIGLILNTLETVEDIREEDV